MTATLFAHDEAEGATAVDHRQQIDAQQPVPILGRDVEEIPAAGDAGIVEGKSRRPSTLRASWPSASICSARRHRSDKMRLHAGLLQFLDNGGAAGFIEIGDQDLGGAVTRKLQGEGASQATAAAGDDGVLAAIVADGIGHAYPFAV